MWLNKKKKNSEKLKLSKLSLSNKWLKKKKTKTEDM